jgi:RsiW-degrading membrane proteinase PrsW (M82 family)
MNADERRKRGLVAFVVCTLLASTIMLVGEIMLIMNYHVPRYIAAPIVQAVAFTTSWIVGYQMYYRHAEPPPPRRWVWTALWGAVVTIAIVAIRIMLRLG